MARTLLILDMHGD